MFSSLVDQSCTVEHIHTAFETFKANDYQLHDRLTPPTKKFVVNAVNEERDIIDDEELKYNTEQITLRANTLHTTFQYLESLTPNFSLSRLKHGLRSTERILLLLYLREIWEVAVWFLGTWYSQPTRVLSTITSDGGANAAKDHDSSAVHINVQMLVSKIVLVQ